MERKHADRAGSRRSSSPGPIRGWPNADDKVSRADMTECSVTRLLEDSVLHHRAVSLLSLCFLTLAACGQNPGSVEKGEQGPPGPQGPAGPQGPPGPQGPASQAGGSGLVIHFQQVGCSTSSCTMSCKEGERILNAIAFTPGGILEYPDEHHLIFRPRRIPAVVALACVPE